MSWKLRAVISGLVAGAVAVVAACTSSVGTPACNALINCCQSPNDPDPSSCSETAMSGELSDAECAMELETLEANGTCPVAADGGLIDAGTDGG
jgi:hypothetical protein